MDNITLLITAIALGADAFAVSAAVSGGLQDVTLRHTFRLTWHFGLFQSMMTIIGWYGGAVVSQHMCGINDWIAFAILTGLGVKMIVESKDSEERVKDYDPTRGWSLVGLSVATSLDALAIGVSFSLIGMTIWGPAAVIGVAAFLMTFIGTRIGKSAGAHLGEWAERIGGGVLIAIGARIVYQNLSS